LLHAAILVGEPVHIQFSCQHEVAAAQSVVTLKNGHLRLHLHRH